jgi:hypothetical protein
MVRPPVPADFAAFFTAAAAAAAAAAVAAAAAAAAAPSTAPACFSRAPERCNGRRTMPRAPSHSPSSCCVPGRCRLRSGAPHLPRPRAVSSQNSVLDSLSPTTRKLLFGYLAGLCAETAIYPLDTVRRRQQAFGAASPLGRHNVLSGGCPSTRVAARLRCDRSCCRARPVGIYP